MNISFLEKCFKAARSNGSKYVAIAVLIEGAKEPEIIINSKANFDSKEAYYKQSYNDDLTLKYNDKIKIVGFTHCNLFAEIEADLVGGV